MLKALAPYRKAVVAGLAAAIAAGLPLVFDGITAAEAGVIFAAFCGGAGITWRVPNDDKAESEILGKA